MRQRRERSAGMSKAKLESFGDGRFRVSGILDAKTVGSLLEQSAEQFPGAARLDIDLQGVTEGDSAGLALLIEWLRAARQRGQPIHLAHVPAQVNALARISEVEDLLAANDTQTVPAAAA